MTGTYFLWILIITETGKTSISGSKGFNFDNEGPSVTSFTAEKYSIDGIKVSVTAQDKKSGIVSFEFYIDGVLQKDYTQICASTTSSITKDINITGITTGKHDIMVKIKDKLGTFSTNSIQGETKEYYWTKYKLTKARYRYTVNLDGDSHTGSSNSYTLVGRNVNRDDCFDSDLGTFEEFDGPTIVVTKANAKSYVGKTFITITKYDSYRYSCTQHTITDYVESDSNPIKFKWSRWYYTPYETDWKTTSEMSNVESYNKDDYPSDGRKGAFWYVYEGVR